MTGAFDIIGNIAIVKFSKEAKVSDKKKIANRILKENGSVKTILEKVGKFKGRLRKQETKYVAGERTKEALYKESGCVFRLNIDSTYFSPRLSNERKEISKLIKRGEEVLVMFAGVSPFSIVIAKNSGAKVYSNEINREANKYAKMNIELNNLKNRITLLPGDIKRAVGKIRKGGVSVRGTLVPLKFDVIVMPRPQLKETFLKEAFSVSKKGTRIFYYDFCREEGIADIVEMVKNEAKKSRKKIKIIKIKKAGEVAPYKFRIRIDFRIL